MTARAPWPAALAAGVLVASSLPPFGWWWAAWLGYGVLALAVRERSWPMRLGLGALAGVGQFGVGLFWMREFTLPGTVLAVLLEAAFVAVATVATPARRPLLLPLALVLSEAVRGEWPFGGLPLAGAALGQIGGPLGGAARLGGGLLLVLLAAAAGAAGAVLARGGGRFRAATLLVAVVVVAGAARFAPDGGEAIGTVDAVAVQGGGPRGLRAVDTDPADTLRRHLDAVADVEVGHDLVLWPEDVVDVPAPIEETPEGRLLAGIADELDATFVAGVVADIGETSFANEAVAWDGDGTLVDRYEKVHRVPFGEYVPFRGLISRLADVSAVPRDARVGRGPGVLDTPAGRLGVLISYEVFFSDRNRSALGAGAELLVVPTNAASFTDSQVPTQQVAAARLRATEAGRDLLQAGPTGYSVAVDHRGRVRARSTLEARALVPAVLARRQGTTVYARHGDGPLVALAAAVLAASWWRRRRIRRP